jgi:hypothetical protein
VPQAEACGYQPEIRNRTTNQVLALKREPRNRKRILPLLEQRHPHAVLHDDGERRPQGVDALSARADDLLVRRQRRGGAGLRPANVLNVLKEGQDVRRQAVVDLDDAAEAERMDQLTCTWEAPSFDSAVAFRAPSRAVPCRSIWASA